MERGAVVVALLGLGSAGAFVVSAAAATVAVSVGTGAGATPPLGYPTRSDLVVETVASGSVVPRRRVELTSQVTGIVEALAVAPGDTVAEGDVVARVRAVADPTRLSVARSEAREARLALDRAAAEVDASRALRARDAVAGVEVERAEAELRLAAERHRAAAERVAILTGDARVGEVRSTLSGVVLAVGVEVGGSVIEAGPYGQGTSIARVADLSDLVFDGSVPETEVGRLREGMAMTLDVSAAPGRLYTGVVESIAPEGEVVDGAVRFGVRAAVQLEDGDALRVNTSALARIVVDERRGVVVVDRGWVRFDGERTLVDVWTGSGFAARPVTLGLSDGLRVEVVSGLSESDPVRPGA